VKGHRWNLYTIASGKYEGFFRPKNLELALQHKVSLIPWVIMRRGASFAWTADIDDFECAPVQQRSHLLA
jgi:hypothetical protein